MLLFKYERYYVGYRNTADLEVGDYRVLHVDQKVWLPFQGDAYH